MKKLQIQTLQEQYVSKRYKQQKRLGYKMTTQVGKTAEGFGCSHCILLEAMYQCFNARNHVCKTDVEQSQYGELEIIATLIY